MKDNEANTITQNLKEINTKLMKCLFDMHALVLREADVDKFDAEDMAILIEAAELIKPINR